MSYYTVRKQLCSCVLVALLSGFFTAPASPALYTVVADDFNDGFIDSSIWTVRTGGGFQVTETGGSLVLGGTFAGIQNAAAVATVNKGIVLPSPFEVSFLMKATANIISGCDVHGGFKIPPLLFFGWGSSFKIGVVDSTVIDERSIGDWHAYKLKYDGVNQVDFFIDGVQKGSGDLTFPQNVTIAGSEIDCRADPSLGTCNGQVVTCEFDNFSITADDTVPPVISNLSPADGSFITTTNQLLISAIVSDELRSGVDESSIQLKIDGQHVPHAFDLIGSGAVVVFTPQPLTFADGKHTVALTVKDRVGNQATASWFFTVDVGGPAISDLSPPEGGISNSTPLISAKLFDPSGFDTGSIVLKLDGNVVTHTFIPEPADLTTATVSFQVPDTQPLSEGTHTVFLSVKDTLGRESTKTWSFTVDLGVPPDVPNASLSPPEGSLLPALSTPEISAVVTDASGIDATSIILKLDGQVVVHTFDSATGKVSFQVPQNQSLSGGTHTVELTVKDTQGNKTIKTWTFKVAQLTEAHLTNATRPGATDIAIGEQYKLRALGDPGQTVTGILVNADRIPPQPGQIPVLAVFSMPEVSSGVYESVQTVTTFTDVQGFTASKVIGAVTNVPPEQEQAEPIVAPEVLTVVSVQVQITSVTLSNATRPGATDVGPGEFLKVTAEGVNLTTAEVVLLDADHVNEPFALVQGPVTMQHASPQLQALLRLENLTNQAGNAVTAITAKVTVPGTSVTALAAVALAVVPDTTPPTITTTINGAPPQAMYNPTDAPLNIVVTATDDFDQCPKLDTTLTRSGSPVGMSCTFAKPECEPTGRRSICTATVSQSGDYTLTTTAEDEVPNVTPPQTYNFTLVGPPQDNAAPAITNLTPANGSTVTTAVVSLSAGLEDKPPTGSGLNTASIVLQVDGVTVNHTFTPDPGNPLMKGTVSFTATLGCGSHTVSLTACDNATNCKTSTWSFTVSGAADTTPPSVSAENPANGSTVSTCPVTLSATLLDNAGGSGVDPTTVGMTLDTASVIPSYDPVTGLVSFTPATLSFGFHTVTLTASDLCGNSITPPFSWSFNLLDTTPPVISSLVPPNGSSTINTMPTISAVVSDDSCPSGVNAGSIVLKLDGSTVTHTFDPGTGVVSFTPPTPISLGLHSVSLQLSDNAGNPVSQTWSFTVITPVPIPKIFSVTPATVLLGKSVLVTILGSDFQPGITAKIMKVGDPTLSVPCGGLTFINAGELTCTIDAINLSSTYVGLYDFYATNPDGGQGLLASSFSIITTRNLHLETKLFNIALQAGVESLMIIRGSISTSSEDVVLTDFLPPELEFVVASGGTFNPVTRAVVFNFGDVLPQRFEIGIVVRTKFGTPRGTIVTNKVTLETTSPEITKTDNTLIITAVTGAPVDPNNKIVIPEGLIKAEEPLAYTIQFENEGDLPARKVVVKDVLDPNLDENAFLFISDYGFYDPTTRTITWIFENINLAPKEFRFISFGIKPQPGLTPGTQIKNKASVFFDFEAPIDTPTVINTLATEEMVRVRDVLLNLRFLRGSVKGSEVPIKNALLAKLDAAISQVEAGFSALQSGDLASAKDALKTASNNVHAFLNDIQAQDNKKIHEELASLWTKEGTAIHQELKALTGLILPKQAISLDAQKNETLQLTQVKNFPNPSKNPHTKFYYKPSSGTVASAQIEIYTLSGKLMVKIFDPTPQDGEYVWDIPKSVANGVYLYRVTISDGKSTLTRSGKMVLLR